MKGKLVAAAASNGGNQTDLLVCFPSRAHLALMPKPICSPSRPAELPKRHHHHHHHQHSRHQHGATTKTAPAPTKRNAGSCSSRRKNSSPLFKAKARDRDVEEDQLDEPTSPRITCAGQIRVRPSTKARSSNASSRPSTEGKNWMSVMEEIERMRKDGKKKPGGGSWLEAIGIKKDALQMFSSFHGLRFNMGCFGSFPGSIDCTSDDDEEEEDEGISVAREEDQEASSSNSNDVFSKWFMLIEENHDMDLKEEITHDDHEHDDEECDDNENEEKENYMQNSSVPPPNALLLMRCRSAPAKGLINRAEQLETEETKNANKALRDQEDHQKAKEEKEKLVVMRCAPDFFKVSMDIAKETWVIGGELDLLARSRSCRR